MENQTPKKTNKRFSFRTIAVLFGKLRDRIRAIPRKDLQQLMSFLRLVLIAVLIVLCVFCGFRVGNTRKQLNRSRNVVAEQLFSSLYMFCQTFDQVNVPNLDVEKYVVPQLNDLYTKAVTLNDVLTNAFGARYGVLTNDLATAITKAFGDYETAFETQTSYDKATSDMQVNVEAIRALLERRYKGGQLQPSR